MTRRFKQLRRFVALLLIIYWTALFVGTHLPAPLHAVGANDKLLHLGAYAGLSFLLVSLFSGTRPRQRRLMAGFAVVVSYGALDELSQLPIPGRHGDVWDWFADVAGAILGLLAYLLASIALQQRLTSTPGSTTNEAPLSRT